MSSAGVIAEVVGAAATDGDGFDRSGAFLSCGGDTGSAGTATTTNGGDGSWFEGGASPDPPFGTLSMPMLVFCMAAGMVFVAWAAAVGTAPSYSYNSSSYSSSRRDKQPREAGPSGGLSRPPPRESSAVPITQGAGAKSEEEGVPAAGGGNARSSSHSARRPPVARGSGRPMSWSDREGGIEPISPNGVEVRAMAKGSAACLAGDGGRSSHGIRRDDASGGGYSSTGSSRSAPAGLLEHSDQSGTQRRRQRPGIGAETATFGARAGRRSNREGVVGADGIRSREKQQTKALASCESDAVEEDERPTPAMVAAPRKSMRTTKDDEEESLLGQVRVLLGELERDLDAARVLLPECHRFRQVVGCVSEAVGPGMRARPRQSMDLTEALKEAKEFSRTLSSPESFLVFIAELLADGVQDPSAMLGQCTRRLSRAVSALPEPSPSARAAAFSSPSSAAAARALLRSIAKSSPVGSGAARSSSAATAATNSGGGGGGGVSAPVTASSSTTSSGATATVTPPVLVLLVAGEGASASAPCASHGGQRSASIDVLRDDPSSGADLALAGGAGRSAGAASLAEAGPAAAAAAVATAGHAGGDSTNLDSVGLGADGDDEDGDVELEGETACGGSGGGPPDGPDVRRSIGPALTSEAAGLSDLIRRRGGLAALLDGRAVAAVLRAAAPRWQSAFHHQRARGFFDAEAVVDEGLGGSVSLLSTPPQLGGRHGVVGHGSRDGDDGGEVPGGETSSVDGEMAAAGVSGGSLYVSTTCSGMFFSTKSPVLESSSSYEVLRWPSPQDTSGICQKLARRVESRVEAMAPFACTHPIPASEHRRLRNANVFFFSIIMPQPDGGADLFRGGGPVVNEADHSSGDQSSYSLHPSSSARGAVWSRHRQRRGGGVDVGGRGASRQPVPDLEEQLYAALGALLEVAKELLPGAREGGVAMNIVGKSAVLTLKGTCALDRSPLPRDTSLSIIPRKKSMCQHTVCTPRFGRKTLEGGVRHEDGVLLVPDCRKLRQEMIRSTCMDPVGAIRPDYVAYAGTPVLLNGAPLGTMCVFSRRTLKDLGWTAHHSIVLRGLADAASTEMMRLCRIAELGDQQQCRKLRAASESPKLTPTTPPRLPRRSQRIAPGPLADPRGSSRSTSPTVPEPALRASSLPEINPSLLDLPPAHSPSKEAAEPARSTVGVIVAAAGIRDTSPSLSPVGTAGVGDGGAAHVAPVAAEVALGTSPQQPLPPPQRLTFSSRLDGVASSGPSVFARRRLNAADRERSGSFRLPLLTRRFSGGEAGTGAVAAAGGPAEGSGLGGGGASRALQPGNAKKTWRRALSKLRLKPRRTSLGEVSDEGDEGSSSSAEVFVERSRAW